jgi:hypothetical protein
MGVQRVIELREEAVVAFEGRTQTGSSATHVRSSLLCSSVQAIRAHGHFDAYLRALPVARHAAIVGMTAGQWLPIDLAVDHYAACDALNLLPEAISAIGGDVAQRVHRTVLGVAIKLSREVGATPWVALKHARRLRDLTWKGGDVAVWKVGPKEARFEWSGMPCAQSAYYQWALCGFLRSHLELFCRKAYASRLTHRCDRTGLAIRLAWV